MICRNCKHKVGVSGTYLIKDSSYKCHVCNEKCRAKITHEEFCKRVDLYQNKKMAVVGVYAGALKTVLVRFNTCGHEVAVMPVSLYKKEIKCIQCSGFKAHTYLTHEEFVEKVNSIYKGNFTVVSQYKGVRKPITLICTKCGTNRELSKAGAVNEGEGCSRCSKNKAYSTKDVSEIIKNITDGEYEVVGEYVNAQISFEVRHNSENCGRHVFNMILGNFTRQGRRCPSARLKNPLEKAGLRNGLRQMA